MFTLYLYWYNSNNSILAQLWSKFQMSRQPFWIQSLTASDVERSKFYPYTLSSEIFWYWGSLVLLATWKIHLQWQQYLWTVLKPSFSWAAVSSQASSAARTASHRIVDIIQWILRFSHQTARQNNPWILKIISGRVFFPHIVYIACILTGKLTSESRAVRNPGVHIEATKCRVLSDWFISLPGFPWRWVIGHPWSCGYMAGDYKFERRLHFFIFGSKAGRDGFPWPVVDYHPSSSGAII